MINLAVSVLNIFLSLFAAILVIPAIVLSIGLSFFALKICKKKEIIPQVHEELTDTEGMRKVEILIRQLDKLNPEDSRAYQGIHGCDEDKLSCAVYKEKFK